MLNPVCIGTGQKLANFIWVSYTNAIAKLNLQRGDELELTATLDRTLESETPHVAKYRLLRPASAKVINRDESKGK